MPPLWTMAAMEKAPGPLHARATGTGRSCPGRAANQELAMAKGLNQKKTEKKKPEKTLKEKRAEKANKKAGKA
ncbi:hypothetical protein [Arenimonas sp. MALMAid1274]|uniref:hypothetical protein n=1 Tax=Arenimonas sp. MALMAid1274 TaxID=3411630 RepID=UPI003BA384BD